MAKKRLVDTWKTKQWFQVYTPELFGNKQIGEMVASDEKALINRVLKVGLDELTGDLSQTYTIVKLRVVDVKGKNAYTKFIGHEQLPSYIKTFIRRRKTLIDDVVDIKTSDGENLRIKLMIFTAGKVARDAEAEIRTVIRKELTEKASKMTLKQLLQEILFKKFAVKFVPIVKKIAPLKRIEFRKTEVKEVFAK